jgi:small GTP-binding protein
MEPLLKILVSNYILHSTNILGVFISDRNGKILVSKLKKEIEENPIFSPILKNFHFEINAIIAQSNIERIFFKKKLSDDIKYSICSLGELILITIAKKIISDLELKVYSINIAEKAELIFDGKEKVSLEIPEIMKIFSKTKDEHFPPGEHSIKVIVIGDYKAGKSSFVKRLIEDQFDEYYDSTVGFNISKKILSLDNTNIRFSIWDTGGLVSQISPTKEKIFYNADAALIIIDKTQPNNLKSIQKWYNDLKTSIPQESPIIIIGTKNDMPSDKEISDEDIKKLATQYGISYISTSAKTGNNINEVLIELTNQIIDNLTKLEIHKVKRKYKNYYLNSDEYKALEDLEFLILDRINRSSFTKFAYDLQKLKKKGFPVTPDINETSFGINIQNGKVIEIGLFNCGLTTLPDSFSNLKHLKKLILRCNPLNSIPDVITKLYSLEILDLSLTNLNEIKNTIANLGNLTELYLENNWLRSLPEPFGNLKSLRILNLENNPMDRLPESFGNLKLLIRLLLESAPFDPRGYLIKLPKKFGSLQSLQELDLSSHKLNKLPESFGNLKSLKNLDLFNNRFKTLPNYIENLNSLESINLERNLIEFIPNTLSNLSRLKKINLKNNLITPKEASKRFKAFAFKSVGYDYNRWMKIAESIEMQEDQMQLIRSDIKEKKFVKNLIAPLIYCCSIAFIGLLTFLTTDLTSQRYNILIIWILFCGALIVNLLIGTSIISTISSYFKISVSNFGIMAQRNILKAFDIIVAILLVWAIRAAVLAALSIELIPAINFLFEFTIPDWILNILILFGYNIDLTFLENIDLFLGHFYLKLFSAALVFWALYRNGLSYIKKTAFDVTENKNLKIFLVIGLFGAFWLAVMTYSNLKPLLSIGYYIGVSLGAFVFIWEKNKENKMVFYLYLAVFGFGILTVWLLSLWNLIISLLTGIIFISLFFILRWKAHKIVM